MKPGNVIQPGEDDISGLLLCDNGYILFKQEGIIMRSITGISRVSYAMGITSIGITVLRIVLSVIGAISIGHEPAQKPLLLSLIMCVMILDHYDGDFFRRSSLNDYNFFRFFRRIIDSCSDRLCIQLFCVPLIIAEPHFWVPYCAILLKEFLSCSMCIKACIHGIVIESNKFGKLGSIMVGMIVVFWICRLYIIAYCLIPFMIGFGVLAYYRYSRSYNYSEKKFNEKQVQQ